jgi:tetratricopeptide (TPR) repeat protein
LFSCASKHPPVNPGKRASILAVLVIGLAAFVAYANTFHAPFTFDDVSSINDNPSIRRLWPPGEALSPPGGWGFTVSGRPVLNFSLAINYAISGFDEWSYHALNLAIHILAGLTLFGLVRRTFALPLLAPGFGEPAWPLALVIAVLWTLHPLQTEAVTYVIQRAESLMGLFFLLTLYGFVRSVESPRPRLWQAVAVAACLLGVGTKEIAALAPVLVFLYDRTFVSGSFREAWRRHRWRHLSLLATWLPLFWLLAGTGGDRGGTFHFADGTMWVGHGLTQFEAVTRYIGLTFWPHPQVFDYGLIPPPRLGVAFLWALPVVTLVAATVVALWRWPVAGFLGAWFFVILAPTSALPATLQIIVEHRMYLPLAAILALVLGAAATWFGPRAAAAGGAIIALGAGMLTLQRNAIYGSQQALWEDTVAKRPENARAQNNLGYAYYHLDRIDDAIARYDESLRLDPSMANTHYNLGLALMKSGRLPEAVAPFEETVRILPYHFNAHLDLGIILMKLGREPEARAHFAEASRYDPAPAEVHFRFGVSLAELGRWNEAIDHYAQALQLDPAYAAAQSNWGVALLELNSVAAAIEHFNAALRLRPDSPDVHFNLGLALDSMNRPADAAAQYAEAVRLNPELPGAQLNLGVALGKMGKLPEAIAHLQRAVRLQPGSAAPHTNLATALVQAGRTAEALSQYEAALRLQPDDARAQYNVGYALLATGRQPEARPYFENALRLQPGYTAARDMLRRLGEMAAP